MIDIGEKINLANGNVTVNKDTTWKVCAVEGDSHVGDSQSHMEFDSMFDSCHLVQLKLDIN